MPNKKYLSTPYLKLLSKIKPYSARSLSMIFPKASFSFKDERPTIPDHHFARKIHYGISNILKHPSMDLDDSKAFSIYVTQHIFQILDNFDCYIDVPNLSTFRKDITTLKNIAEKYEKKTGDAINVLIDKYEYLYLLGFEELEWKNSFVCVGPDFSIPSFHELNELEIIDKAHIIKFCDDLLAKIPIEFRISNSHNKEMLIRCFMSKVYSDWKFQKKTFPEKPGLFCYFIGEAASLIVKLINDESLLKPLQKKKYIEPFCVKKSLIKKISQNIISGNYYENKLPNSYNLTCAL